MKVHWVIYIYMYIYIYIWHWVGLYYYMRQSQWDRYVLTEIVCKNTHNFNTVGIPMLSILQDYSYIDLHWLSQPSNWSQWSYPVTGVYLLLNPQVYRSLFWPGPISPPSFWRMAIFDLAMLGGVWTHGGESPTSTRNWSTLSASWWFTMLNLPKSSQTFGSPAFRWRCAHLLWASNLWMASAKDLHHALSSVDTATLRNMLKQTV